MTPPDPSDLKVEESRIARRVLVEPPIRALFGTIGISIVDFGERGIQAEHSAPMSIGLAAKLVVSIPGQSEQLKISGTVVWSRLSKTPDSLGKYLYRSGIRVDEPEPMRSAIEALLGASMARPDIRSLDKKRKVLREKRMKKQHPTVKTIFHKPAQIPTDQVLLIQQARERLALQPDEAVKWYHRAKFSFIEAGQQIHYRDDILAVWEYLERTIDLAVIAQVIEKR
jgi:Tfp pilus assembly protein PilZ